MIKKILCVFFIIEVSQVYAWDGSFIAQLHGKGGAFVSTSVNHLAAMPHRNDLATPPFLQTWMKDFYQSQPAADQAAGLELHLIEVASLEGSFWFAENTSLGLENIQTLLAAAGPQMAGDRACDVFQEQPSTLAVLLGSVALQDFVQVAAGYGQFLERLYGRDTGDLAVMDRPIYQRLCEQVDEGEELEQWVFFVDPDPNLGPSMRGYMVVIYHGA